MGDTWAHVREWLWHLVNDPMAENRWAAGLAGMMLTLPLLLFALLVIHHGRRTMTRGATMTDDTTEPGTVADEFGPMYAEPPERLTDPHHRDPYYYGPGPTRPADLDNVERWETRRQLRPPAAAPPLVRPFTLSPDAYTGVHAAPEQPPGRHAIPDPREHDLTGIDYAFTPRNEGRAGHIASWSAHRRDDKPLPGDYLILRNPDGERSKTSRYRVLSVNRCLDVDPPTMWTAELVFDPRMYTDADE